MKLTKHVMLFYFIAYTLIVCIYYASHFNRKNTIYNSTEVGSIMQYIVQDGRLKNRDIRNGPYENRSKKPQLEETSSPELYVNESIEVRFKKRRDILDDACKTFNDREKSLNFNHVFTDMIYSSKYDLLACIMAKNGATALKNRFRNMIGYDVDESKEQLRDKELYARFYFTSNSSYWSYLYSNQSILLLTARHPLDRIVSAYRDKFKDGKYTPLEKNLPPMPEMVTNGSEISKYGSYSRKCFLEAEKILGKSIRFFKHYGKITFEQYLSLFLKEGFFTKDKHFRSAFELCVPCQLKYDYIIHTETFNEDMEFILNKLNITGVQNEDWGNPTMQKANHSFYTSYFERVEPHLVRNIIKMVEKDFHLFGYEIPESIKSILANDESKIKSKKLFPIS